MPDSAREGETPETSETSFEPGRFWFGVGGFVVADLATMYGLNQLWYADQGQTSFAWYTDRIRTRWPSAETHGWLDDWHTYVQQDKIGHFVTAWHLARVFGAYGKWAGMSRPRAGLFGGTMSAFFQGQIEVLDGFAVDYGASRTDMLANTLGAAVGGLQVAYPELNWFTSKYSYHFSPYRDPATGFVGNALKDYDGISYWLVVRPERLLPAPAAQRWPDWLAVSFGYSGTNLAHAISGLSEAQHAGLPNAHQRQYFIGLDLDVLATVDLPQPWHTVARFFSFVRIPAPALEFGAQTRWHWLYY